MIHKKYKNRKFRNAVTGSIRINRITLSQFGDSVYVHVYGKNPGFKIGDKISVYDKEGNFVFTDSIYNFMQTNLFYTLFVKRSDAAEIAGQIQGTILVTDEPSQQSPTILPKTTYQMPITTPTKAVAPIIEGLIPEPVIKANKALVKTNEASMLIAGGVLAVAFVIFKITRR